MNSILQSWRWPAALALPCVLLALGGDDAREALRWQRGLLVAQPWRLFTAHLLHLDGYHLILNLGGLAVTWSLVGDAWRAREWTVAACWIALCISVGLLSVAGLGWYVGLSGVLHGLLAMGAVGLRNAWRAGALIIALFLLAKSVSEYVLGAPAADTVVAAHWFGIGAGTAAGILGAMLRRGRHR